MVRAMPPLPSTRSSPKMIACSPIFTTSAKPLRSLLSRMSPARSAGNGSSHRSPSESSPATASPSAAGRVAFATSTSIVKTTVQAFQEMGAKPFVVAAMGSHGGADAEGQRELLASYDIDEEHLGVPVKTDMDSRQIGVNSWGEPVWWDCNALGADGVVTVSRIKPHTDYPRQLRVGHRQDVRDRPGQARRGVATPSLGLEGPASK